MRQPSNFATVVRKGDAMLAIPRRDAPYLSKVVLYVRPWQRSSERVGLSLQNFLPVCQSHTKTTLGIDLHHDRPRFSRRRKLRKDPLEFHFAQWDYFSGRCVLWKARSDVHGRQIILLYHDVCVESVFFTYSLALTLFYRLMSCYSR